MFTAPDCERTGNCIRCLLKHKPTGGANGGVGTQNGQTVVWVFFVNLATISWESVESMAHRPIGKVQFDEAAQGFRVQFHLPLRVDIKDRVKAIVGARWVSARRSWWVPHNAAGDLLVALHGLAFEVDALSAERLTAAGTDAAGSSAAESSSWVAVSALSSSSSVAPILAEAVAYRARQSQLSFGEDAAEASVRTDRAEASRGVEGFAVELQRRDTETRSSYLRTSSSVGVDAPPSYPSVYALMQRIERGLRAAFGGLQWVVGVVQEVTQSRQGHLYLRLKDVDPSIGADRAVLSVAIFGSAAARVLQKMSDHGLSLDEGVTIALSGTVGMYAPRSSLQFVAQDIDVRVSRGEVDLQRDRVVGALREAGLSWKNARVGMPLLPERIALVTSAHGDALHDVVRTLIRAKVGASLTLFDVPVQGPALEGAVLEVLARIASQPKAWDVVLIVRGGGAANELAWWDNLQVGTAIAHLPCPVVVGIGHERDETALHEVARFDATPTAAAQRIAQLWRQARDDTEERRRVLEARAVLCTQRRASELSQSAERFHRGVARQLEHAELYLYERLAAQMQGGSRRAMARTQDMLQHRSLQVARSVGQQLDRAAMRVARAQASIGTDVSLRKLERASGRLDSLAELLARRARAKCAIAGRELHLARNVVRASDPSHWLQRGYAIVRDDAGNILRDIDMLVPDMTLDVQMHGGRARSVVRSVDRDALSIKNPQLAKKS